MGEKECLKLKTLEKDFTICKVDSEKKIKWDKEFYFVGKTDEEISLVCLTRRCSGKNNRKRGRMERISDRGDSGLFFDWNFIKNFKNFSRK